jgi:hypothetical protein
MRRVLIAIAVILLLPVALVAGFLWLDGGGAPEQAGTITGGERPEASVTLEAQRQHAAMAAIGAPTAKQVLFGDLHVHSTFSMDAFLWSLPMMQGEGAHPPADACDYARYCASLDFWSLTDHAEGLTPRHWTMIKDTVRQCDALTDPANPDLVTFLGWEWTQVGQTPETHFGHRNVHLLETAEDRVPARPISAGGLPLKHMRRATLNPVEEKIAPYITDFSKRQHLKNLFYKQAELRAAPYCPDGVPVRELPPDCVESAETPDALSDKLDEWGFPAMVIPHGTTWGFYTPPGSSWDKQLNRRMYRPAQQPLVEIFSGHGNSEEYRSWRDVEFDAQGNMSCPEPRDGYVPCCHRAGELIQARCDNPDSAECAARVAKARQDHLEAGVAGHLVVPGAQPEDWLNCGQCPDCYLPAFAYRPRSSVQYMMALSNFDEPGPDGEPLRFRFGFIASSDNHASRPGTGYKEIGRLKNTEAFGAAHEQARDRFMDVAKRRESGPESIPFDRKNTRFNLFQYSESERQASFFHTGGLVAAHSAGRTREAIWDALSRKEVYGTSGDRILLWFDLLNADDGEQPMGAEVAMHRNPRFRVRAIGAFQQKPGCPPDSLRALGEQRLDYLCGGECYHPGDARHWIERIEVVRIRPQAAPGEDVRPLIEDPWRTFDCPGGDAGCTVEFEDPEYAQTGRDTLYYVRALQAKTPMINAGGLRCTYDETGACVAVDPCYGDERTDPADDCTALVAQRAWSSPIFVDYK